MAFVRFSMRQFEVFAAVLELRSFTAAADRLAITTQAVSQAIADLEASAGFRLFDRTTRRVAPTDAGRDFGGHVHTVLRHVTAAEVAAADMRDRATGLVRIGAPIVLASMALPAAVRAYAADRPGVVVRICDLHVDALLDSVAAGDVDLAVGPDRPCGDEVASVPVFDSRWVVWCAPGHPLARARRVSWADLRAHPIVAAGRDHERSVARMRPSDPEDTRVTPVDIVDNISTALGIAAQGLAVTLTPAYVGALARLLGLEMRRVVEPEAMRTVCLYRPLKRTPSPAAEAFGAHLCRSLAEWNARVGEGGRRSARARPAS